MGYSTGIKNTLEKCELTHLFQLPSTVENVHTLKQGIRKHVELLYRIQWMQDINNSKIIQNSVYAKVLKVLWCRTILVYKCRKV